ncbi:DUF1127 domain-containing protein [Pararhodobacter oceanensis]|nr:DUF1127 domain-containing protein [Pararhodobacter oceanensis]
MHPFLIFHDYLGFRKAHQRRQQQRRESNLLLRAAQALRGLAQNMMTAHRRRRMIAALEGMDDRLLRDIGLYRCNIREVVESFSDRELSMRPVAAALPRSEPQRTVRAANSGQPAYLQAA